MAQGKGGGRKRTPTEREESLAVIAKLDRRGYSQPQISKVVGVSQQQVCNDLKQIRKRYRDSQVDERIAKVEDAVARLEAVIQEAWEAWDRSKEDAVKEVTEELPGEPAPNGEGSVKVAGKMTKTVEGRLPHEKYLVIIKDAEVEICKLRELYPAKDALSVNVNTNVTMMKAELGEIVRQVDEYLARNEAAEATRIETDRSSPHT